MKLVTGNTIETSVEAADDRALNAAFYGKGDYVFNIGNAFSHEIIDNNTIKIHDGSGMMGGAHFTIPVGEYDVVNIDSGRSGYNRIDLICAKYSKNQNSEDTVLTVIKGTETEGTPEIPEYTVGDILAGTYEHDFPLKKVTLTGTNIEIENLYSPLTAGQKLLWSGKYVMKEGQTVNLKEPVSNQRYGLELIFAPYNKSTNEYSKFNNISCRISKAAIFNNLEGSFAFNLNGTNNFASNRLSSKYLRFDDNTIKGSDNNILSGTGSSGITFDNNGFVLIAVYGV